MKPALRKLVLVTHVIVSVGWFGAAAAYTALVASALASQDARVLGSAAQAIRPIMWTAIVPLALASVLTGVVQSLGTPWGLFRHYWVIFKLVLTVFATAILLANTRAVNAISQSAAFGPADAMDLRGQLVHASLGMLVLLVATVLGVYKPRGLTRYGWRRVARTEVNSERPASRVD